MPPIDTAPVDTSVVIPDSVRRAAAAADAIHAQAYGPTDPPPVDPNAAPAATPTAATPPAAVDPNAPINIVAAPAPQLQPQPQPQTPPAEVNWEHRYLSMEGRYKQAAQTIGSMQGQMSELGNELVRTQQLLNQRGPNEPDVTANSFLTPEDEANFGKDLIDFVQRAAKTAVNPQLQHLENKTEQDRRLALKAAQAAMYTQLVGVVPNWEAINDNPRFMTWLRLPDLYSGRIRQQMLNEAFQAANAPRVIAFFQGFVKDEQATGQSGQLPQAQPSNQTPTAAVPLETLVAPGAARPASGNTQVPAEKPIYTHSSIAAFYTRVRQGYYAGRDADKQREEAEIFAAQREGRIR